MATSIQCKWWVCISSLCLFLPIKLSDLAFEGRALCTCHQVLCRHCSSLSYPSLLFLFKTGNFRSLFTWSNLGLPTLSECTRTDTTGVSGCADTLGWFRFIRWSPAWGLGVVCCPYMCYKLILKIKGTFPFHTPTLVHDPVLICELTGSSPVRD